MIIFKIMLNYIADRNKGIFGQIWWSCLLPSPWHPPELWWPVFPHLHSLLHWSMRCSPPRADPWDGSMEARTSQVAPVVKNPPANAGNLRDSGLIPGLGRSPGGRQGNPLQYSCLENPMDRGAWRAAAHRVTKSQTRLKQLSMHACSLVLRSELCE